MREIKLLEIKIKPLSKNQILEQIKKYIETPSGFFHIVSINPENIIIARENHNFKRVIESAHIQIIDGVGVVMAARLFNFKLEKITGVDLMQELLKTANELRLRVLLVGGGSNLALKLANCYHQTYPKAKFFGLTGIKDIKNPAHSEEKKIFSIVTKFKPQLVFAAFGSPEQELWLERHKREFAGAVCIGVGGAFNFLSGLKPRAPYVLQRLGLEWLFRLLLEPWRWRRQLRLIKFTWQVFLSTTFRHSGEE